MGPAMKQFPPSSVTPAQGCAWVTGASSGIGEAVAIRLVQDGWTVMASARSADKLAQVAAGQDGRIVPVPVDVTDLEAVKAAVASIETMHGPIALAILNAGTYTPDSAKTFQSADVRMHMEINVMGTVHCIEALLPGMIARESGQIAVVSSVAGYRGLPRASAYGASKAALIRMSESLKFDLDRLGIKMQVVNPGFVRTPLTDKNDFPMPMIIEAEEAADKLVRGLADNAFEITFPRRFTFLMQRLRGLPYGLYFACVRKMTGS